MLQNPEVSDGLMDHLDCMETFTFYRLPLVRYSVRLQNIQNYRSRSVIRRTVFVKKFLISTKNYHRSLGASYRRIFFRNNFFYHSYWYDFKQIKGHTVLVIDFYKWGGSEKNCLSCVLPGVYSSSLPLSVSNSLFNSLSASMGVRLIAECTL